MNQEYSNERFIEELTRQDEGLLDDYQRHLTHRGYRQSTRYAYLVVMRHWLHWRATMAPGSNLDRHGMERFIARHLPTCCCECSGDKGHKMVRAALNQALLMCGHRRVRTEHAEPTSAAIEGLIARFDDYLETMRGLAATTRWGYRRDVRRFLWWQYGNSIIDVSTIKTAAILEFALAESLRLRPASVRSVVGSLRAFFRFQQLRGYPAPTIEGCFVAPCDYRLSSLPHALDTDSLQRFWASFDVVTPIGKRDYAMARCLADLGLRCAEVAGLRLEAFEWRNDRVRLTATKTRREALLPLPGTTAGAVADYLRHGRPQTESRSLFVYHRAPLGMGVQVTTVRGAIRRAFDRAGLPFTGTHVLRRTLATQLLHHGAPLNEIADVLRHRSIDTTRVYTKVDYANLRQVAMPWPGGSHE